MASDAVLPDGTDADALLPGSVDKDVSAEAEAPRVVGSKSQGQRPDGDSKSSNPLENGEGEQRHVNLKLAPISTAPPPSSEHVARGQWRKAVRQVANTRAIGFGAAKGVKKDLFDKNTMRNRLRKTRSIGGDWRKAGKRAMILARLPQGVATRLAGASQLSESGAMDDDLVEEVFHRFDINEDGTMDARELGLALQALGFRISTREVMEEFDIDHSRSIDLEELKSVVRMLQGCASRKSDKFAKFDSYLTREKSIDTKQIDLSLSEMRVVAVPRCIRDPTKPPTMAWDSVQMILLTWVAFYVTLTMGFDLTDPLPPGTEGCGDTYVSHNGGHMSEVSSPINGVSCWGDALWWWDLGIDLFFLVDIIFNFFTAYIDQRQAMIVDFRSIALTYMFGQRRNRVGWFWLDLASGFPLQYIAMFTNHQNMQESTEDMRTLKVTKIFKLAKLLKLVRISKAVKIFKRYQDVIVTALTAFGLCILIIWIVHSLICLWFLVGHIDEQAAKNCMPQPIGGKVRLPQACQQGWVIQKGWDSPQGRPSLGELYVYALNELWMRGSQVDTTPEKLVQVLADLIFTFVFSAISGLIFTKISSLRVTKEEYNKKFAELREFAASRNLSGPLRSRILSFNRFLYDNKTVFDEEQILSELPLHMRSEVVYAIYGDMIKDSFFFFGMEHNESAVIQICMRMQASGALEGDDIFCEGDIASEMFFLQEGMVILTTEKRCLENQSEDYLDRPLSLQRSVSRRKIQPPAVLITFEFGEMDSESNDVFVRRLRDVDLPYEEGDHVLHTNLFSAFRKEMHGITGVYKPHSKNQDDSFTKFIQQSSQKMQIERHKNRFMNRFAGDLVDPWVLEFHSATEDSGSRTGGHWSLSNSVLIGELMDFREDGTGQREYQVPLGRERLEWRWRWQDGRTVHNPHSEGCPQTPIQVSIVELVESVPTNGSFGELAMLRLGGMYDARMHDTTATAMEDSHFSTLSYEAYLELKTLFPREMENNEEYFLKRSQRQGTSTHNFKRARTKRRGRHTLQEIGDDNKLRSLSATSQLSNESDALSEMLAATPSETQPDVLSEANSKTCASQSSSRRRMLQLPRGPAGEYSYSPSGFLVKTTEQSTDMGATPQLTAGAATHKPATVTGSREVGAESGDNDWTRSSDGADATPEVIAEVLNQGKLVADLLRGSLQEDDAWPESLRQSATTALKALEVMNTTPEQTTRTTSRTKEAVACLAIVNRLLENVMHEGRFRR